MTYVERKYVITMETKDQFLELKETETFYATKKFKNVEFDEHRSSDTPILADPSFSAILVHPSQKGNPLLKSITNVPYRFDNSIIPDYVMGRTVCALFLTLKYHNQHPNYIDERLRLLKKLYTLRVLLVQVDVPNPNVPLNYLTKVCLLCDLTLLVAWNSKEAGQIIENYKIYENKPPDTIMEKQDSDARSNVINALTTVRSVNRTDADTLLKTFGTLENIIRSSKESLILCSGLGPQKSSQLYSTLRKPFLKADSAATTKNDTILDFFQK